jgi:hypothetical protein
MLRLRFASALHDGKDSVAESATIEIGKAQHFKHLALKTVF